MHLRKKITLVMASLAAVLIAILVAVSLYSFRAFSVASATEHLRSAAEIVRVSLTEAMVNGVIHQRESLLARLKEVEGLKSVRVIRGPLVSQQFGPGINGERTADAFEEAVLQRGQAFYQTLNERGEEIYRGTIPFTATGHGVPNCLQCHQVKEGDVLGAVTLTISIEELKHKALETVAWLVGIIALFTVLIVLLVRHIVKPIDATAVAVEKAVQKALEGDFKTHIEQRTNDEIGKIAGDLNRLLAYLHQGLTRMGDDVAQLTHRTPQHGENLLTATMDAVGILTKAAHFKQAIEEDETRQEIYQRLARVLRDEYGVREFSIYEADADKNRIVPMLVDGEADAPCRWCSTDILVRPESCRAGRTGHVVDGSALPRICGAFSPPEEANDRTHLCVPLIQSGGVGCVVQLVVPPTDVSAVQEKLPYIAVYLREAAPVIEAKRLMATLREANLRDAMTGLNNRRFLEEYVETLVASVQRRETHAAILMLDLDYFKMVNDTYGHDAGDTVLRTLAKTLKASVRSADMVIRYGGEEFLIILNDTDGDHAMQVAETIREKVAALKIQLAGTTLQKTISIGVSEFPKDSDTFWQAVKFADVALYRAKESGRNRVVRFTPELWDPQAKDY